MPVLWVHVDNPEVHACPNPLCKGGPLIDCTEGGSLTLELVAHPFTLPIDVSANSYLGRAVQHRHALDQSG